MTTRTASPSIVRIARGELQSRRFELLLRGYEVYPLDHGLRGSAQREARNYRASWANLLARMADAGLLTEHLPGPRGGMGQNSTYRLLGDGPARAIDAA